MNSQTLAYGPLSIRILAEITFIVHGLSKFESVAGTQGFFGSVGLPPILAIPIGSYWWDISACRCSYENSHSTFYNRYDWSYIPCKATRRICRRLRIGVVVDGYSC